MEDLQNGNLKFASGNRAGSNLPYLIGFAIVMLALDALEICCIMPELHILSAKAGSAIPSPRLGTNPFTLNFDLSLLLGLIMAQTILLALWSGLGNFFVTFRCFVTLIFIESWCLLLPFLFQDAYNPLNTAYIRNLINAKALFNTLLPMFLIIAIPLWIGRLFGLKLLNIKADSAIRPSMQNRFQFSIRCLLEWITIAAVFMGSLTYILGKGEGFALHREWKEFAFKSVLYAVAALILSWAVLGIRWTTLRVIIQVVVAFMLVRSICLRILNMEDMSAALSIAFLLASLWFLRRLDYRLVWGNYPKTIVPAKEPTP